MRATLAGMKRTRPRRGRIGLVVLGIAILVPVAGLVAPTISRELRRRELRVLAERDSWRRLITGSPQPLEEPAPEKPSLWDRLFGE